ncbi:MAG: rhodanese-like domain-containing protein [Candidatus Thermoplasmatota archaeon]|jgi:rhodanese-related sulfurtransferase|nr:rhodanese-like domain-containing protein [Candidatus Thermoplasmatota archaeon]MDP7266498.1 rhodanese-like domain-containing protein [Candidatus Thermoplasmatota archaeon]
MGPIIEKISIDDANEMIRVNSDLIILDVRTSNEFGDDRLVNSINIDFYGETFRDELNKLDKNGTYIIYCRSGNRSGQTLEIMDELKFMEVYDFGSFVEWKGAGYDTVNG